MIEIYKKVLISENLSFLGYRPLDSEYLAKTVYELDNSTSFEFITKNYTAE